jgi:hypothetical protein
MTDRTQKDRNPLTSPAKKNPFRFLILDKKEVGMKFQKGIIIISKMMDRDQISMCFRSIENFVQKKITIRGI